MLSSIVDADLKRMWKKVKVDDLTGLERETRTYTLLLVDSSLLGAGNAGATSNWLVTAAELA